MVEIVYFYKGEESHYSYFQSPPTLEHEGGLFFATDTKRLYLNGEIFGRGVNGIVDIKIENSIITIIFEDGTNSNLDLSSSIDVASEDKNGLLSITDKQYIDYIRDVYVDNINQELNNIRKDLHKYVNDAKTYSIEPVLNEELSNLGTNIDYAFKLVDEDGTQVGSYIKILKEKALKSVELDNQSLIFTYELSDGSTNVVSVDLEKFLSESEFKDGLIVDENGVVSIRLSETTDSKNFLLLEGDENKSLAVRTIDTDCAIIEKDIIVAGLPSQLGAGYKNGNIIPKGTTITDFIETLMCKEIYPTPSKTSAKISVSISQPSVSLSATSVEVGTEVYLNSATTGSVSVSTTNSSISGMSYGYSLTDDDKQDFASSSIIKSVSYTSDNQFNISASVSNFTTTPQSVSNTGSASLVKTLLGVAKEGTHTITVSTIGPTYNYSADAIETVYYCSNLYKTDASKNTSLNAVSGSVSRPTNSRSASVTGYYNAFWGYSTNTTVDAFDSDSIRSLGNRKQITNNGTTTLVSGGDNSISSNGTSIVIACPTKYKLNTINNALGASIIENFSVQGTVNVQTGTITTSYNVYIYPITNGAIVDFKNVTLKTA